VLFGCIPVMLKSVYLYDGSLVPMGLPLEEELKWERFAVLVDASELENVHLILANITLAQRLRMRRALGRVYKRFMYSSIWGSYQLGDSEDPDAGGEDAFEGLMRVLGKRVARMPPLPD